MAWIFLWYQNYLQAGLILSLTHLLLHFPNYDESPCLLHHLVIHVFDSQNKCVHFIMLAQTTSLPTSVNHIEIEQLLLPDLSPDFINQLITSIISNILQTCFALLIHLSFLH